MGADDVITHPLPRLEDTAHRAVEFLSLADLQQALSIRRIADHRCRALRQFEIGDVRLRHSQPGSNTCLAGVVQREGHRLGIEIPANTPEPGVSGYAGMGLFPGGIPTGFRDETPPFRGKVSAHSRGDTQCVKCRFDQQRARPAERVYDQRIPAHMGQVDNAGCKGLLDWGQRGVGAVSPFMQSLTGGIQHQSGHILVDRKLDLVHRAGLLEPGLVVDGAKALNHGLFDDGLAIGYRVELGVQRPALDRKGIQTADEILKRQRRSAVKQLCKGARREGTQLDEHPLRRTQLDICLDHHRKIPLEGDLAVGDLYLFAAHSPDFAGENALQTEQTGAADRQFFHRYRLLSVKCAGIFCEKAGRSCYNILS